MAPADVTRHGINQLAQPARGKLPGGISQR
jgi:hypothetical protein